MNINEDEVRAGKEGEEEEKYDEMADGKDGTTGINKGKWGKEEHERYLYALEAYDRQADSIIRPKWSFIQKIVRTRTISQCRSHHQKFQMKMINDAQKPKELFTNRTYSLFQYPSVPTISTPTAPRIPVEMTYAPFPQSYYRSQQGQPHFYHPHSELNFHINPNIPQQQFGSDLSTLYVPINYPYIHSNY